VYWLLLAERISESGSAIYLTVRGDFLAVAMALRAI
jgi:hypothetical protein